MPAVGDVVLFRDFQGRDHDVRVVAVHADARRLDLKFDHVERPMRNIVRSDESAPFTWRPKETP